VGEIYEPCGCHRKVKAGRVGRSAAGSALSKLDCSLPIFGISGRQKKIVPEKGKVRGKQADTVRVLRASSFRLLGTTGHRAL